MENPRAGREELLIALHVETWALNVHFPIGIPIEVNVNCPGLFLLHLPQSRRSLALAAKQISISRVKRRSTGFPIVLNGRSIGFPIFFRDRQIPCPFAGVRMFFVLDRLPFFPHPLVQGPHLECTAVAFLFHGFYTFFFRKTHGKGKRPQRTPHLDHFSLSSQSRSHGVFPQGIVSSLLSLEVFFPLSFL